MHLLTSSLDTNPKKYCLTMGTQKRVFFLHEIDCLSLAVKKYSQLPVLLYDFKSQKIQKR